MATGYANLGLLERLDVFPEGCFTCIEKRIKSVFFHPEVLAVFACIAYGLSLYCAVTIEHWTGLMIVAVVHFGLITVAVAAHLYKNCYIATRDKVQAAVTRYRATNKFLNAVGSIAVLVGFVFLSKQIEKDESKLGFHAIGFFLSCYVVVVSFAKLYRAADLYGTGDSLMAVTLMLWVNNHSIILHGYRKWIKVCSWIGFFVIVVLLTFFKMTDIKFRGDPVPDGDNQVGIQLQTTDLEGETQQTAAGATGQGT